MEAQRLADQLRRSYEGNAWHGPSLGELLESVTAEKAARKPVTGAHSIWEIVQHVEAWAQEARLALGGKDYVSLSGNQDWPPVSTVTDAAWRDAQDRLRISTHALVDAIGAIDDVRLNEAVAGRDFNYYVLLHGVVQHNIYHAGQISLLLRQT